MVAGSGLRTPCLRNLVRRSIRSATRHLTLTRPESSIFNGISKFPAWTGFHDHEHDGPTITISDEEGDDDSEDDERTTGRSRSVATPERPLAKRADRKSVV